MKFLLITLLFLFSCADAETDADPAEAVDAPAAATETDLPEEVTP